MYIKFLFGLWDYTGSLVNSVCSLFCWLSGPQDAALCQSSSADSTPALALEILTCCPSVWEFLYSSATAMQSAPSKSADLLIWRLASRIVGNAHVICDVNAGGAENACMLYAARCILNKTRWSKWSGIGACLIWQGLAGPWASAKSAKSIRDTS